MQVMFQLFLLLSSAFLARGADQDSMEPVENFPRANTCNETVLKEFDECWQKLPQAKYQGIPSNPKKIVVACSVFITGVECVGNWSKQCLSTEAQEKLNDSIVGALQTYQRLCANHRFREEYHQHVDCFDKVSSHWDVCNNQFMNQLEKIDEAGNLEDTCCVRMQYIQCVNGVVRRLCTKSSSAFLTTLNMFLMQSTLSAHQSCECTNVVGKTYHGVKSASQYLTNIRTMLHFSICYAIMIWYRIV